jgi:hypothetical protein
MTSCNSVSYTTTAQAPLAEHSVSDPVNEQSAEFAANGDGELVLLALQAKGYEAERVAGRTNINVAQKKVAEARKKAIEAREKAEKAAEEGGFWGSMSKVMKGDVATTAAAIGSVAAIAASGGAATPLVLAGASLALRAGAKVNEELGGSKWITAGLAVGAVGASILAGDPKAATGLASTAQTIATVANYTEGGALVVGGGATAVEGHYLRKERIIQTDVVRAETTAEEEQDGIGAQIGQLTRVSTREQSGYATVSQMQAEKQYTNQVILDGMRG